MRHFFLDTNVVFDYLGRREPNGAAAAVLFQAAYEGRATLHVASLSFSHIFYTLRKQFGAQPAREALRKLARLVRVVAVDEGVVQAALDSEFADVEDAMQYFAALNVPSLAVIVTNDPKGFRAGAGGSGGGGVLSRFALARVLAAAGVLGGDSQPPTRGGASRARFERRATVLVVGRLERRAAAFRFTALQRLDSGVWRGRARPLRGRG